MKKYKLRKEGRTLLWTYLVPLAIVSLSLVCDGFCVMMRWVPHSSAIMARALLFYATFIGSVIIFLASGISVSLFLKKRDKWVDWAICIGIALTLIFVTVAALQIVSGWFWLGFDLFPIGANMAFLALLIRHRANLAVARGVVKGEPIAPVPAVTPKVAKVLFSIAVCSLCVGTVFACTMVWPMAIIGLVLLIILFTIYSSGRA